MRHNKINSSKSNGTLFEQIGLAFIAAAGEPYFANSGYIATSDEEIQRWVENEYTYFTHFLGKDRFLKGWGVQGKIHIGDLRIDPDFFNMKHGRIFEFKYQESAGSMVEKLYKNLLTYQAIPDPSYIVYHGVGFDKRFFQGVDAHRQFLKNPDITQFISFNEFIQREIGLNIDITNRSLSIAVDKDATLAMRKKHSKLKEYTERVVFDTKTNEEIVRFKTLQLLEDAKSDGFKDNTFFKNVSFNC